MVHLGLLAGFTGGGGRGDCGGRRPLGGPGPVGSLGEALYLEGLGDLEELIQLLLGHVDLAVVHEVEDVLHILGGDPSANVNTFVTMNENAAVFKTILLVA